MMWDDPDQLPEIPADILDSLNHGDPGDIGDHQRSALQRVIAINQRLYRRAWELEQRLHDAETNCHYMRQQIVGLVQLTRRLGYEPSVKQPR